MTEGRSAQLANRSRLEMTRFGGDQPVSVRSAKVSVVSPATLACQLRTTLPPDAVSCGCAVTGPAGDVSCSTFRGPDADRGGEAGVLVQPASEQTIARRRAIVNFAPPPSRFSTRTAPPCNSIKCFTI